MKISVITVSYNSAATIVDTVESVLGQTHAEVEYLLMDGGSTDATLAKLEPYRERIDVLVSEPDGGMYAAMNKGIARATGDVVAILNSDDIYADAGVLARVAACFAESDADCVYGDLHYVSPDLQRVVRNWVSGAYQAGQFKRGWHPPHPSFFVKAALYQAHGGFQTELRIAADFEFMLRVLEKEGQRAAYLPEVLVKMRTGGASNRSLGAIWRANRECYQAWRVNGYSAPASALAVLRKPLRKLKQYF
ncbi:MAG: glycosyltransferase [Puniceicoccaceae bacterium]|nr:MAG: glycosyltransferase [Puniceicoccaceae bacterium]